MGDRCYIRIYCRMHDTPRFEQAGFALESHDPSTDLAVIQNEEGYFDDHWPKDIPYFGSHCEGYEYDGQFFACDGSGAQIQGVEVGLNGFPTYPVDEQTMVPDQAGVEATRVQIEFIRRVYDSLGCTQPWWFFNQPSKAPAQSPP